MWFPWRLAIFFWEDHGSMASKSFMMALLTKSQVSAKCVNFDQFSPSSFEMREFSHFNKILLDLSDVLSAFHDTI